jgi:hypothetical protein
MWQQLVQKSQLVPYLLVVQITKLLQLRLHHLPSRIRHYLDDFLKIFAPSINPGVVQHALEWSMALGAQLGLRFQPSKVEGPATCLEFLGIELDSIAMEARLPASKLMFLVALVSD